MESESVVLQNVSNSETEVTSDKRLENINSRNLSLVPLDNEVAFAETETSDLITLSGQRISPTPVLTQKKQSIFEISGQNKKEVNIISNLTNILKEHVHFSNPSHFTLVSVIIVLSYCVKLFTRIPYLHLTGLKGSGKTTVIEIIKNLLHRPKIFTSATVASIFRVVHNECPTLILDEVDSLFTKTNSNSPVFQVLNSGYQRDGLVPRVIAGEVFEFSTYCLKIIAGINDLHPTTADRCIRIEMERAPLDDAARLKKFYQLENADEIVDQILIQLSDHSAELMAIISNPETLRLNSRINNRNHDLWFPILTLAKVFSTPKNNFFRELTDLALEEIGKKLLWEEQQPESLCAKLIGDFITENSEKTLIPRDLNFLYFSCDEIRNYITRNDPFNFYRNKADVTKILKSIGVQVDRRRVRREGQPGSAVTTLYKVPRASNNQ